MSSAHKARMAKMIAEFGKIQCSSVHVIAAEKPQKLVMQRRCSGRQVSSQVR